MSFRAALVRDHDAAQRRTIEQQAQEIERLDKDLGAERVRGNFYKAEIDRSDALLNQFGIPNIAHECGDMLKPVDERIELVFVRLDTINQQLAARTAERDEITSRWKHEFELRCKEEDKNDQLQARLTASEARVKRQGDVLAYLLDCGPEIVQAIQEAKSDLSEDYGEEQRQEREALREQLRTLQQAKEWTEARPKVAGWYWLRAPKHGWRDAVVWIEKDGDGPESYFYMPDDDSTPVDEIDGEWQGPLTPGEE